MAFGLRMYTSSNPSASSAVLTKSNLNVSATIVLTPYLYLISTNQLTICFISMTGPSTMVSSPSCSHCLIGAFNLTCFKKPLRSEEHTSELQSRGHLVCRLLLET